MNKYITIILLGYIFCFSNTIAAALAPPNANCLIKNINAHGSKAVIKKLTEENNWAEFEQVCNQIETGKKEWLEVARLLVTGSDAATTESLVNSVSRALPNAPFEVLSLIAKTQHDRVWGFTVNNICISTHIEPEPGVIEKYFIDSEKALKSLDTKNNPLLNELRIQCLKNIHYYHGQLTASPPLP